MNSFLSFYLLFLMLHPVHLSVTNIDYNQKSKNFEISIRLFVDDFNKILFIKNNINLNLGQKNENPNANFYITNYITSHLSLKINGKQIAQKKFILQKKEYKDVTIWLYYKIKFPQKVNSVEIKNTLMTDLYRDQKNLLIFTYGSVQKALEFNFNTKTHSFKI